MKTYIDFLLEEMLLEDVSRTQFRFGFELEGYVKDGSELDKMLFEGIEKFDDTKEISVSSRSVAYIRLREYFMEDILSGGFTESELIRDETIRNEQRIQEAVHDDVTLRHDWEHLPFEFSSPVFPHTTEWIRHIISCLQKWVGSGFIFTDSKCGFHNHISYSGMTKEDMMWIYAQICTHYDYFKNNFGALKEKYGPNLTTLVNGTEHEFFSRWASEDNISKLQNLLKSEELIDFFENSKIKTNALRVHPRGTIEWRGPRNFMNISPEDDVHTDVDIYKRGGSKSQQKNTTNEPQAIRNIKQFYVMMNGLIRFIIKCEQQKTITIGGDGHPEETVSKEQFFEKIKSQQTDEHAKNIFKGIEKRESSSIDELKKLIRMRITGPIGTSYRIERMGGYQEYYGEIIYHGKNLFIIKNYDFVGKRYNFKCRPYDAIYFDHCSIIADELLFVNVSANNSDIYLGGRNITPIANIKNCSFTKCDFMYYVTNLTSNPSDIIATNNTFEEGNIFIKFLTRCLVDNSEDFTNNTFNSPIIISNYDALTEYFFKYIHMLYVYNDINKTITITHENSIVEYSPEECAKNWIGNEEMYKKLIKNLKENSAFSFNDLANYR